jgi:hypothetical protein
MALQQPGCGVPERGGDGRVQAADLLVQGQPAAAETAQRQVQPDGGRKLGAGLDRAAAGHQQGAQLPDGTVTVLGHGSGVAATRPPRRPLRSRPM